MAVSRLAYANRLVAGLRRDFVIDDHADVNHVSENVPAICQVSSQAHSCARGLTGVYFNKQLPLCPRIVYVDLKTEGKRAPDEP